MRREDLDVQSWVRGNRKTLRLLAGAVRTEQLRRGSGSAHAAANHTTLPAFTKRQQTPARVCLSNFPPEILSLIFSHLDTATLLGAVPCVCHDWRAACAHDLYGPKVRLQLRSVRQVLRIRPECLELWVAATVGHFTWVIDLDLSGCGIEDGVLECASSLQRITSLDLSGIWHCPSKTTDTGLEHVAKLTQLTSLNLSCCVKITDTGLEHVAKLTQLTSLDLINCDKITDTGLEYVAHVAHVLIYK